MVVAKGFSVESRYIPKGAVKVADKKSDAVAYLYNTPNGEPGVRVFYGKQSKPVLAWYFTPYKDQTATQRRAAKIVEAFTIRQETLARKEQYKAERKAKDAAGAAKVAVGTYYYSSWGYDQTNIDWYRVEKLIGSTMALVVQVAPMDASNGKEGWMQGKAIPSDTPKGEPFKVRLQGDGFKVRYKTWAYRWDGTPKSWTAYA